MFKSLFNKIFFKKAEETFLNEEVKDNEKVIASELPLYKHQEECLKAIRDFFQEEENVSGRIVIPTGGGKSRIESIVVDEFGVKQKDRRGASLVLFHRIALGQQHVGLGSSEEDKRGFREWIGMDDWVAAAFHSGEHYAPKGRSRYSECSTTNPETLQQFIAAQNNKGKYVIVFSTYHSYHKLTDVSFDVMIADESQFLVQEKYFNVYDTIDARRKLCFTATEKWTDSDSGFGLNNESMFGPRVYEVKAAELIEQGIIVKPKIHVLETSSVETKSKIFDLCRRIAKYHADKFEKTLGFSKTLFAISNSNDLLEILKNQDKFRETLPGYDIFIIHSREEIGVTKNGEEIKNRNEFLDEIRASKNCLIFHYDILSEGIDISGITGVAILRSMNTCKLLQTVGRSLRLHKENGVNIKEYSLVTIPVWNNCKDDWVNVQRHLIALRTGGFPLDESFDISYELVKDAKERLNLKEEEDLEDLISSEEHTKSVQKNLDDALHLLEKDMIEELLPEILKRAKSDRSVNVFEELFEQCNAAGFC